MERNTNLREAIFKQKLTQRKLADGVGLREEYLSMAINGRMFLKKEERRKIAVYLGTPMEQLFPVEAHLDKMSQQLTGSAG